MRSTLAALALLLAGMSPIRTLAQTPCPRTTGTGAGQPGASGAADRYGTSVLSIGLGDGIWSTTRPGALIAVKLFWQSEGFRPGMESDLSVTIRNVNGGPMTARVSRPTNAGWLGPDGESWERMMLTGIDFPDPGCWEITGRYHGEELTFIVETVENRERAMPAVSQAAGGSAQRPAGRQSIQERVDALKQRPDPVVDLRSHVERWAGAEPADCGRHVLTQRDIRWIAADEAALEDSVACGLAAAAGRRAFWTFKQELGVDSWVAVGLLGTSEGVIYRFNYDSAPCGGSGCASRISFEQCDRPVAATDAQDHSVFRCLNAWADVQSPERFQ